MSARAVRLGRAALAAIVAGTAPACDTIVPSIFRPTEHPTVDTSPPVFSDPRPSPDVTVVSAPAFTIEITDAGSGVDPTRVEAHVVGGAPRPLTVLLPRVTIHVADLFDGPLQVAVVARDHAGNSAVHVFTVILDRTPPAISFSTPPPDAVNTAAVSLRVDMVLRIDPEPNFEAGAIEVRTPGPDGTCGTADDGVPTTLVGQPSQPLTGPGSHAVAFFFTNPVPPFGPIQAVLYCWIATARDAARSLDGTPGANTSRVVESTLVTWRPPPPG